jgi:hypothetical protein
VGEIDVGEAIAVGIKEGNASKHPPLAYKSRAHALLLKKVTCVAKRRDIVAGRTGGSAVRESGGGKYLVAEAN